MNHSDIPTFLNPEHELSKRTFLTAGSQDYQILGMLVHSEFNKKDIKYCGRHHSIETRDSSSYHKHIKENISCPLYSKKDIQGKFSFTYSFI